MSVIAIIPARGGSKRLPRKNIRDCAGRPLLDWTAQAALASERVDRAILSTDDAEIADIGQRCGLEVPFLRPTPIADDDAPMLPVLQHLLGWLRQAGETITAIVLLQPTSPLRLPRHVDEAVRLFFETEASSVVSVVKVPHQFHPLKVLSCDTNGVLHTYLDAAPVPGRGTATEYPPVYARNGPAIVVSRPEIVDAGDLYGTQSVPYVMQPDESVDIDELRDFELAELYLRLREKNAGR